MDARKQSQTNLSVESMTFPRHELLKWQEGDHGILDKKSVSSFLKRILNDKASRRQGTRFFGEAYVAAELCRGEGWYGSFKWLTSSRWLDVKKLKSGLEAEFGYALQRNFEGRLASLQKEAGDLFKWHGAEMEGKKPVAPDLWLVIDGVHHFIECKAPHDTLAPHQIAGLALIAKHLGGTGDVVTRVIELRQDPVEIQSKFESFVR